MRGANRTSHTQQAKANADQADLAGPKSQGARMTLLALHAWLTTQLLAEGKPLPGATDPLALKVHGGKKRTSAKRQKANVLAELNILMHAANEKTITLLAEMNLQETVGRYELASSAADRERRGRARGGTLAQANREGARELARNLAMDRVPPGGWSSYIAAARAVRGEVENFIREKTISIQIAGENLITRIAVWLKFLPTHYFRSRK